MRKSQMLLSLSSVVALGQEPAESAKDQARLSDLLNRSEQLRREGRPANAVALIEEALVLARKATGEPTKEVVRITEELAKLHEEREDFAAARASRRLVLEMSTKLFGDRDWRTNDARLALVNVDRLEGMTRDQRRRLVDLHHSQETAERLFTQRLTADALDPARRALEECRALLGERSREFIRASNILGILYAQDRDLERAEPLLRQA
ncbi:MAG: hypothetical protein ACLP53_13960 [Isosphaeraceae bacterium]